MAVLLVYSPFPFKGRQGMGAIPLGDNYITSAPTFHPPSQGREIASSHTGRVVGSQGIPPYSLVNVIFEF